MIKKILRRINEGGLGLTLAVMVAMCCGFGAIAWIALSAVRDAVFAIEDPTERGLAYVAAAIVAHSFLSSGGTRKD